MAKFLALLFVALVALALVEACAPPGMMCSSDSDCCGTFVCNPWAGRCTGAKWNGPYGNDNGNGNGRPW
ncbi:uncharacterized protein LOC109504719 [Harpegnathos saltator]|uniref:Uncharacterized protein n=1 Tax=Harpegnathos saltator TaxID=610380 RepID=E2B985_HARSA|nr:uncharacterized protein LOC109504719 [Harpegnathos saltator]EFN87733.1 hypothetical protein EAI_02661 [Harpegnathos saltator]